MLLSLGLEAATLRGRSLPDPWYEAVFAITYVALRSRSAELRHVVTNDFQLLWRH
jgi:hypothetical protein